MCQHPNSEALLGFLWCFCYNQITLQGHFDMKGSNCMAEFGEKLKTARSQKGITQQTLADQLFVTRQAVSRWEGGSRYPDLLTAKKISQILDTSLDELLCDDALTAYPQKASILESSVSRGIQTVLISVVLMCYLIICVWYLPTFTGMWELQSVNQMITFVKPFLFVCVLLYAAIASIQDRWTPHLAAVVSVTYFGVHAVSASAGLFSVSFGNESVSFVLKLMVYVLALLLFGAYFGKETAKPLKLYVLSALFTAFKAFSLIQTLIHVSDHPLFGNMYLTLTVHTTAELLFLGLLCYMVSCLDVKRKRAAL